MDMEFNDLQSVATFVSEVSDGKYHMAREDWLTRNYQDASAKLLVWLFNHTISLEQRIAELEKANAEAVVLPDSAPEDIEEDDKH